MSDQRDLDREKERAQLAMVAARDGAIWRACTMLEAAYNRAHLALLAARTPHDVAVVEVTFIDRVDGVGRVQRTGGANDAKA